MLRRLASLAVGAAVAEAVLWDGGFDPAARVAFAALAGSALLAAALAVPGAVTRTVRRPVVLVLLALGLLGLLSTAWTIGEVGYAVRWGLVTLGYACLVVATAALTADRPDGARWVAFGIAAVAGVSATVGLIAVLAQRGPYAERVGGAWRPGGTLEYAPALGLLEVSALPVLVALLRGPGRGARAAGAIGGGVALLTLALSGSRLQPVLGLLAIAWALAGTGLPRRARRPALLALAGVAIAGLAALAVIAPRPSGRLDGGFTHGRLALWRAGVESYADRPVIGSGADTFVVASVPHQTQGPVVFAHDLPLELAVELGAGGLLLGLGLYAAGVRALRRAPRPAAVLLGPAVAAFLTTSLVDWPWHLAGSGAVLAVALGGLGERIHAESPLSDSLQLGALSRPSEERADPTTEGLPTP